MIAFSSKIMTLHGTFTWANHCKKKCIIIMVVCANVKRNSCIIIKTLICIVSNYLLHKSHFFSDNKLILLFSTMLFYSFSFFIVVL